MYVGIFNLSLCCPDCGGEVWHDMRELEEDEFCCCNCGTVCSIEEMLATAKEVSE